MAHFAVIYTYVDQPAQLDENRPAHRAFLATLLERGHLVASGPLLETSPARALLIFTAESADQLREILTEDPFQQLGLVADAEITEWNPVLGILAN
ncbi:YciI family protein [Luteococcus sp. Sow4_B9]|uniref:YciI family protein n=1 Tax=Luteococcus sp. Sow4_B9 TaxID=3438792 RepID=UPI003F97097A